MKRTVINFPVYNQLSYTKRCLDNLHSLNINKNISENLSIVIVDDGSQDGSYNWIKKNYPQVNLVKGNGNLWWSGGVNKGIHYSLENLKCEYILLWNNDIIADKNYLLELFEILKNNSTDNIICSKIYLFGAKDIVLSMGGVFNPKTGRHCLHGWGNKDNNDLNKIRSADWFPGMGTVIHKNVFEKIGYFDEKYFPQYHGDADFGLRAKKAGIKLTVYPNLKIWNDRSNTGLSNDRSFKLFVKSLYSRKSNNNIFIDIIFYKRHATSIFAYKVLIVKYFRHLGGYFKWLILALFGIKRNN